MKENQCAVCGEYVGNRTQLAGGYHTSLCCEHSNAWHLFIRAHPELKALRVVERKINNCTITHKEIPGKYYEEYDQILAELFFVGRDWVEARRAEHKKQEEDIEASHLEGIEPPDGEG